MRGLILVLASAVVVSLAVPMLAVAEEKTVTGEVVELGCLASRGANGVGAGHAACALQCASRGSALGIQTADGVLTITGGMTDDNNAQLLDYVAKNVAATGDVTESGGTMSIEVASIELQ